MMYMMMRGCYETPPVNNDNDQYGVLSSPPPPSLTSSYYDHAAPIARNTLDNNQVRLLDYRQTRVASFCVDGKQLICLPQAFELFLKNLVGGLHTVYTKLKRLDIMPIVCNVEQVRVLRSLGAIQAGVNRCKLISPKEFDTLYEDCTNSSSRPGRPPKRHMNKNTVTINDNESDNGHLDALCKTILKNKSQTCLMNRSSASSSINSSPSSLCSININVNESSSTLSTSLHQQQQQQQQQQQTNSIDYLNSLFNNYSRFKPYNHNLHAQSQQQSCDFLLNNYKYPQVIFNNNNNTQPYVTSFVHQQQRINNSCEQTHKSLQEQQQQQTQKNDKHPLSVESLIGNSSTNSSHCKLEDKTEIGIEQVKSNLDLIELMNIVKKSVKALDDSLVCTLDELSSQLVNEKKLRNELEKRIDLLIKCQLELKRKLKIQRAIFLLKRLPRKLNR